MGARPDRLGERRDRGRSAQRAGHASGAVGLAPAIAPAAQIQHGIHRLRRARVRVRTACGTRRRARRECRACPRVAGRPERPRQRHAAGLLHLGVPHRGAGGFRIHRRAPAAARLLRHRRPPPDGHQCTRLRGSANDASDSHPADHAGRRAAAGEGAARVLSGRYDETLAAEAAVDRECCRRERARRERRAGARATDLRPLLCGAQSGRHSATAHLARRAQPRSARARCRGARHPGDSGASGRTDGRSLGSGRRDGEGESAHAADAVEPRDHDPSEHTSRPAY